MSARKQAAINHALVQVISVLASVVWLLLLMLYRDGSRIFEKGGGTKQPNMLVQMPLLKEMMKMQDHVYTSVLLYIEESLLKTSVTMATLNN